MSFVCASTELVVLLRLPSIVLTALDRSTAGALFSFLYLYLYFGKVKIFTHRKAGSKFVLASCSPFECVKRSRARGIVSWYASSCLTGKIKYLFVDCRDSW